MKYLILNTDYSEFLLWLYAQHPGLERRPYEEQLRVRMDSLFGVADFYSCNLRKLGHEAWEILVNNEFIQEAWAREHHFQVRAYNWRFRLRRNIVPWFSKVRNPSRLLEIVAEQVAYYKPDVILNQSIVQVPTDFLRTIKPHIRLLIGQHAATRLDEQTDWSVYDMIVSSFPPTVVWFRERGMPARLNRLGFEPRVLSQVHLDSDIIPVSFVGSFSQVHSSRTALLEYLASRVPLKIFGRMPAAGFGNSILSHCYGGPAWGIDMYNILVRSRISVNHHGDIAPYANNLRLYETTGVGTLLITDWRMNLSELFEPGKEVVIYRSPQECTELILYYLEHEKERAAIAAAGQQRTLRDHTYAQRMVELDEIVAQAIRK